MAQSGIAVNNLPDGTRVVTFDAAVYRLNAIKKAAYKQGGLFYVLISQQDNATEVRLKPKESSTSLDALVGEFCNEVLDQELRETIANETAAIRDLLLAQAFSKTTLIDPELETGEYDSEHCAEVSGNQ
jgi:His-Xaa-Ser system protein HxsD